MLIIIVFLSALVYRIYKIYATKEKIRSLANSEIEITPEQFLSLRRQSAGGKGNQHISTTMDFAGVYIIYNNCNAKTQISKIIKKGKDKIEKVFRNHKKQMANKRNNYIVISFNSNWLLYRAKYVS